MKSRQGGFVFLETILFISTLLLLLLAVLWGILSDQKRILEEQRKQTILQKQKLLKEHQAMMQELSTSLDDTQSHPDEYKIHYKKITIFVDAKSNIFLDDKPITSYAHLRNKIKKNKQQASTGTLFRVTIRCASSASHGKIIEIMSILEKHREYIIAEMTIGD